MYNELSVQYKKPLNLLQATLGAKAEKGHDFYKNMVKAFFYAFKTGEYLYIMAFFKENSISDEIIDKCCKSLVISGRKNLENKCDKNLAPIFETMGIEFISKAGSVFKYYTPKGWSIICDDLIKNKLDGSKLKILKTYVVDNIGELNKLPDEERYIEIKKWGALLIK